MTPDIIVMVILYILLIDIGIFCTGPLGKATKILKQIGEINKHKNSINNTIRLGMTTHDILLIKENILDIKNSTYKILLCIDENSKSKYLINLLEEDIDDLDSMDFKLSILLSNNVINNRSIFPPYDFILPLIIIYKNIYNRSYSNITTDSIVL